MRLFQVSDYIWRSRTFNGMRFSGVVLSTLGLLLVLVPDSCIGEVCTSCMKHIHTKPNIPLPERRGRRARRDIIRAWPSLFTPLHVIYHFEDQIYERTHMIFLSFIQMTVETYILQLVTQLKFSIKPLSFYVGQLIVFVSFLLPSNLHSLFLYRKTRFSLHETISTEVGTYHSWIKERSVINHRLSKLFETMLTVQWQNVANYLFTIWPYTLYDKGMDTLIFFYN